MRSGFLFRTAPVPTSLGHRQDAPQYSEGCVKTRMIAGDPTEAVRLRAIQLESLKALGMVMVATVTYTKDT